MRPDGDNSGIMYMYLCGCYACVCLICLNEYVMFQHSPPLVQPLFMMTFVLQDGWSPLYTASFKGHLDIVKTLIEAGANVNYAREVQCVGRLHVSFSVIYEHTYILFMTS